MDQDSTRFLFPRRDGKAKTLRTYSVLISLRPFIDESELLRVGARQQLSQLHYRSKHPLIIHGNHSLTRLIVRTEHKRLLHATLLMSSLSLRYHIIGGRKTIRSITRQRVTCCKQAAKLQSQLMGQLPVERITPGPVIIHKLFVSLDLDHLLQWVYSLQIIHYCPTCTT